MVRDLNVPTQLKFCETIREEDGLAMSSRNERFSAEQRIFLSVLPQVLRQAVLDLKSGVLPQKALSDAKVELEKAGFSLDYLAIVNPETMQPEDNRIENSRLIFAGEIFGVRLIDNMPVA
jgi:pantoate--beta-alanine ligase